jgi:uncharacterized protein Usg
MYDGAELTAFLLLLAFLDFWYESLSGVVSNVCVDREIFLTEKL